MAELPNGNMAATAYDLIVINLYVKLPSSHKDAAILNV